MATSEFVFPGARYRGMVWIGRVLSGLASALFCMSAAFKFMKSPEVLKGMETFGFPEHLILPIGIVELLSVILFLVPRTAILGAVLLTGYLGGAIVTHLRIGDAFIMPIVLGIVVWFGVWFREPRLRAILPLRLHAP